MQRKEILIIALAGTFIGFVTTLAFSLHQSKIRPTSWYDKYDIRCLHFYTRQGGDMATAQEMCAAWKDKNKKDLDLCLKKVIKKHKKEQGFPLNFDPDRYCKEKIRKQRTWNQ